MLGSLRIKEYILNSRAQFSTPQLLCKGLS
jgi:hypothetical protein